MTAIYWGPLSRQEKEEEENLLFAIGALLMPSSVRLNCRNWLQICSTAA